jgi:hypothetical protein
MYEPRSTPPYPRSMATLKYDRLKSHSLIESLLKLFMQKPDQTLLLFDQVQRLLCSRQEVFRGTQLIPLSHIVGSVGRYRIRPRAKPETNQVLRIYNRFACSKEPRPCNESPPPQQDRLHYRTCQS